MSEPLPSPPGSATSITAAPPSSAVPPRSSDGGPSASTHSQQGSAGAFAPPAARPPTLSDIAARMNLADASPNPSSASASDSPTNGLSPDPSSENTPARGRLGLAGRLGSTSSASGQPSSEEPAALVSGQPPSRSRSVSPVKPPRAGAAAAGAGGPMPSLQEIRERMSRKGLQSKTGAAKGEVESPTVETIDLPDVAEPAREGGLRAKVESAVEKVKEKVTGSAAPAKAEEAPKAETKAEAAKPDAAAPVKEKVKGHPLQHKWTLYFDSKSFNPSAAATTPQSGGAHTPDAAHAQSWEAALKLLGVYTTVESFMSIFATLRRPSQLERNSNYHLFKSGIKPMWEDPANANGGKWVLTLRNTSGALLDRSWMWLVLALIGEELDDGDTITGAVVSTRAKGDRIALWLRTKDDVELINRLGKKLVHLLDVEREPGVSLEFSFNSGGAPLSATPSGTVTSPQTLRFVHFHNAPAQQMPSFSAQGPLGGYAPRGNMGPPPLPGSSPTKQQLHAPPPQHGPGSSPQRGNYAGSANMIPMPRRGSEQGSLGAPPQHHAGGSPSFGSSPGSGGAAGAFSSLQRHGSQQGGLGVSGGHLGRNGPSPPAPMQSPQGAGAFGTSPVRGSYMPPQARQQQQQGGPMPPPSFGARGPPQPFRSAGSNAGSPPL